MSYQVEALRQAFNKNHVAYAQAFAHVDAQLAIFRAVINDLHLGQVTEDENGNIDWGKYLEWYKEHLQEQEQAKEEPPPVELANPEDVEELVFGGDIGSGNRQELETEADHASDSGHEQGGARDDDDEGGADAVHEVPGSGGADELASGQEDDEV